MSSASAILPMVESVGFLRSPLRFCFLMPRRSANAVFVNPFAFNILSRLSIYLYVYGTKVLIIYIVMCIPITKQC
nr:MAG TPA: hypothetical protein [Caudoviricetes sp.]